MATTNQIVASVALLLLVTGVAVSEICTVTDSLTADDMKQYLFMGYLPAGGKEAGRYMKDVQATNPATCILSCCSKPRCNVALYTNKTCLTLECDQDNPDACSPKRQRNSAYNDTFMILVRTVDETGECSVTSQEGCGDHQTCQLSDTSENGQAIPSCKCNHGYVRKSPQSKECIPAEDSWKEDIPQTPCIVGEGQCGPRQECLVTGDRKTTGVCWCKEGFDWDQAGDCVYTIQTCEFGLATCNLHEECHLAEGSKSKMGVCECEPGYTRDEEGHCLAAKETEGKKTTQAAPTVDSVISTVTPKPADSHTTPTDSAKNNKPTTKPTPKPTTKSTAKPTPKVQLLTVSAGDNKVVQLPDNEVSLKAFVLPAEQKDDKYQYDWTLEEHPEGAESGKMDGKNTDTLKLSNLIAGLYTFRVKVTGTNKFGEASVNVSVLPPARVNQSPVAIIRPATLQIKLPNSAILDGSDSTDDDKIVAYQWEEVSGPLRDQTISIDNPILSLKDLVPGDYTFKLTVTDSDGSTNSTTATVTAIKEMDYPPKANAGSDIVIHLPKNSVILYGNLSTDDKGIQKYEWVKSAADNLAADMQGVRSPVLHVSNLEVGDYTFTLKVTDAAEQTSSADVHVFVKPEENRAPTAVTMGTVNIALPVDSILLDGDNSTDDIAIATYNWQQDGGPSVLTIQNADRAVATASGDVKVGQYEFKLTVTDAEGLKSSSVLTVTVKQLVNEPPVANAGGDVTVQLPRLLVALDGSQSSDDHKISSYEWVREPKSLAAGTVLNHSDHQAVLQLVNLVAGHYTFTLTVLDAEGLSSKDTASITVKEDENIMDMLDMELQADIKQFTMENKKHLEGQLALLVPRVEVSGDPVVHIQRLAEDPATGHMRVYFYAMVVTKDSRTTLGGVKTLKSLKKKLLSDSSILDYEVVTIDTYVCQNNCSEHGHCDLNTKLCVCEAFWTQNIFRYLVQHESNCDWSILYVVLVCFIIVLTVTAVVWGCLCWWRRRRCRCRLRSKKRHRYSLLRTAEDEQDGMELITGSGKKQNSSVMISESEFSSEEETIFINQKKSNGYIPKAMNGLSKQHLKTKLKT